MTSRHLKDGPDVLARYSADKGHFDVLDKWTSPAQVVASTEPALRSGATMT
jgi:hypothetical protein